MKIKLLKDYAINRGACPLNIGGFDMLETEIVKAGTIVDLEKDNKDDAFSDELIKWLIDNGFAEEVKESSWEKPTRGDNYYFINGAGVITSTVWMENSQDRVRYLMGNCFRTTEAAERYRDYLKAIATVRQDEGVMTPEQIRDEYQDRFIHYIGSYQDGQLDVSWKSLCDDIAIANVIYFDTMQHAKNSLAKHPDEWETIANYDWSRE